MQSLQGFIFASLLAGLAHCGGADYMPVYFPGSDNASSTGGGTPTNPNVSPSNSPNGNPLDASCTTQFKASLCVMIAGKISVGNSDKGEDPICADNLPAIPIEIDHDKVLLRGATFPDLVVEGHGLPVPITINGRGPTDGAENLGTGARTADGTIDIQHFTFFVKALDQVGKIPDFALTTHTSPPFPSVDTLHGSPVDASGNLTLVGATKLGSLFPGADAYLKGAILRIVFKGQLTPTFAECRSNAVQQPTHVEISKLVTDANHTEVAVPIPNGSLLEISSGTYIASDPTHVGPRFETSAKFRLTNIGPNTLDIAIPPHVGAYYIESPAALTRSLPQKGHMLLRVTFRPSTNDGTKPGPQMQALSIGGDHFNLSGVALAGRGELRVDLVTNTGASSKAQVDNISLGTRAVVAATQRAYFACHTQLCGGVPFPSACAPCVDASTNACQLLTIDAATHPIDEINADCSKTFPNAHEALTIDTADSASTTPTFQLLQLRNVGIAPLTISHIDVRDLATSQSSHQFVLHPESVVLGNDPQQARTLLAQGASTQLPLTLPPYDPPAHLAQAYVVVGYAPTDLTGSDGKTAGVGASVIDVGQLAIDAGDASRTLTVSGTTTIKDVPPLEAYFATDAGLKQQADGSDFPLQGLTQTTTEIAVPLLLRAADNATRSLRITGISVQSESDAFHFLGSHEQIMQRPSDVRCTLPSYNPDGSIAAQQHDPTPVMLAPNGYELSPGGATLHTMPLFGCVQFVRDPAQKTVRQFSGTLTITAQPLDRAHQPERNPDGSLKNSTFQLHVVAVIDPFKGNYVMRVTQTMSVLLNPQFPTIASSVPYNELQARIAEGVAVPEDQFLFLGAFVVDPFDEETVRDEAGNIVSTPGDGHTAIFRAIDTHPVPDVYDDPFLRDYSDLTFNADAPTGQRGSFFDFPNVPEHWKTVGLKLFTATLSYPGPLAPEEQKPASSSACESVDPCSPDGQRKYGTGPTQPGKKGVCAFYHISAGEFSSPAFHTREESEDGAWQDLCTVQHTRPPLKDIAGNLTLDGQIDFDLGLRFWGPTYFHNPNGPLGQVSPLDQLFHFNLTTRVLRPSSETPGKNLLPDARINVGKQEYKLNLSDPKLADLPILCPRNTQNETIQGKKRSTWEYLAPLISLDPEGQTPAGCKEPGNAFTGGVAYFHGRPLNYDTGVFSVVGVSKFGTDKNLTFAFQNAVMFVVLNGWMCDPNGNPDNFEGARCFDLQLNHRDAASQISVLPGATP